MSKPARPTVPLTAEQQSLIEQWIPFAIKIAGPFKRRSPMFKEEIHAAAMYGLVLASQCWDSERGVTFGSYCGVAVASTIKSELDRRLIRPDMGYGRGPNGGHSCSFRDDEQSLGLSANEFLAERNLEALDRHDAIREYDDMEEFETHIGPALEHHKPVLRELFVEDRLYTEVAADRKVSHQRIHQIVQASAVRMGLVEAKPRKKKAA